METRDQWCKPNLLYNIHYRSPKKPEPPKMIVETVQFNPSVCTCGEHGCQPQYRMEKRVLWTNKEACNAKQQSKIKERANKDENREDNFQESITVQDGKIVSVNESKQTGLKDRISQERRYTEGNEGKQMELKEEIGQKCHLKEDDTSKQIELKDETGQTCRFIEDDGNKSGADERFQKKLPDDVNVSGGCKATDAVNENESVEVQGHDDDEVKEEKEDCDFKNEPGWNSKNDVCTDEEASNTNNIKQNNSNGKCHRDKSEGENSERVYGGKVTENYSGSVLSNACNGDGKCSQEGQMDKDNKTGDSGTDHSDGAEDTESWRENIILINDSHETAESRLEREDGDLDDVEIASDFGIMTIYCNSELHCLGTFKVEDALK